MYYLITYVATRNIAGDQTLRFDGAICYSRNIGDENPKWINITKDSYLDNKIIQSIDIDSFNGNNIICHEKLDEAVYYKNIKTNMILYQF